MLKRQRKLVSVAVALSLTVAMGTGLAGKPARAATDYGISNPVTDSSGVTTWDKVKFGSYYQTAQFEPEPIKWRVLSVNGDDAFLLADENLDGKPYNTEWEEVTWETCSMRKWQNEDFYNEAFSDSEKAAIRETKVVNKDNPEYGTVGGDDTTDRIYLLSLDEAENVDYGFVSISARESNNTDYAKCNHAWSSSEGNGEWWLRSPGRYSNYAANVDLSGCVYEHGDSVDRGDRAVRPALHLNLSSSSWSKSGQVSNGELEVPLPSGSPSASENPKPSSSPTQTATTPPQATNAASVTASPVPTGNSANTGKLGKVSIKSAKNSKKSSAVLTWKKVNGASSYQIQYALDQKFAKGTKSKTTAGTSYTLKKLKKKKTYYVRIRALKKAGSKNVYGAWSKVKKVKIKK